MKIIYRFVLLLGVAACATPATMLKNEKTGQIVRCGGSTSGSMNSGYIGYEADKRADAQCVADYERQGYVKIAN